MIWHLKLMVKIDGEMMAKWWLNDSYIDKTVCSPAGLEKKCAEMMLSDGNFLMVMVDDLVNDGSSLGIMNNDGWGWLIMCGMLMMFFCLKIGDVSDEAQRYN